MVFLFEKKKSIFQTKLSVKRKTIGKCIKIKQITRKMSKDKIKFDYLICLER